MKELKTIVSESNSNYTERGSRFIGYLTPTNSIVEFKVMLKNIRIKHENSSHVCSAYRFFNNRILQEKGSDDGEPSGSAGLPMLNVIKRSELVNVACYVVRYFGGTKLGIPGLVHSYSESVRQCIIMSNLVEWSFSSKFLIVHNYQATNKIDFLIRKYNGELYAREFNLHIESKIAIKEKYVDAFKKDITENRLLEMAITKIK